MDKCPWCGAAKDGQDKDGNIRFSCLTWAGPHCMGTECQSERCKDRQIARLQARVEKLKILKTEIDAAWAALESED